MLLFKNYLLVFSSHFIAFYNRVGYIIVFMHILVIILYLLENVAIIMFNTQEFSILFDHYIPFCFHV